MAYGQAFPTMVLCYRSLGNIYFKKMSKKILKSAVVVIIVIFILLAVFSIWYVSVYGGTVNTLALLLSSPANFIEKTANQIEASFIDMKIRYLHKNIEFPRNELNSIALRRLKEMNLEPVQPILVIVDDENAENKFGRFIGEILLSEGVNEFQVATLSNVTSDVLKAFDLVILTQAKLTGSQLTNFEQYVSNGGSLLTMKPDKKLAPLCGITSTTNTLREGYIQLQLDSPLAKGLIEEPIQYHGVADIYRLDGAEIIAYLFTRPDEHSARPAITRKQYRHGTTVCFAYDLISTVVYLRQGNPDLAGKDTDGFPENRPNDMFQDFIDVNKDWIPQADIHQHILSNLILELAEVKKPLPRWYPLPDNSKALLIMTGDGCGESSADNFRQVLREVENYGGNITYYYYYDFKSNAQISSKENRDWLARGHGTSVHPSFPEELSQAEDAIGRDLVRYWVRYKQWPKTIRTHGLSWVGYVKQAEVYERMGIRMDLTYVSYLPAMDGYMSGSALPMRFVDTNGLIINVYQQPTQFEDDIQMIRQSLTTKQATERSVEMLRQSIERFHEPVVMNMHPFNYVKFSGEWARNTMAFAKENGIPIYSAEQWLAFWEAREQAEFTKITFQGNVLSFNIQGKEPVEGITLMIPLKSGNKTMKSLHIENNLRPFMTETVWGKEYALSKIDLMPGKPLTIDASYR